MPFFLQINIADFIILQEKSENFGDTNDLENYLCSTAETLKTEHTIYNYGLYQ